MDSSSQIPEPITLLRTKLRKPCLGGDLIPRPRLVEPLNRGLDLTPRVTLVSALAGCGKTTLLCQSLDVCDRPSAWLSLDHTDNDLVKFLSYLIAAVQTLFDDACGQTRSLLRAPTQPPLERPFSQSWPSWRRATWPSLWGLVSRLNGEKEIMTENESTLDMQMISDSQWQTFLTIWPRNIVGSS